MFTDLYEKICSGEERISLIGLGYVGMPIAVAFAKKSTSLVLISINIKLSSTNLALIPQRSRR